MNVKMTITAVAVLLALLALIPDSPAAARSERSAIRDAIDEGNNALAKALQEGDAAGAAKLFTKDARLIEHLRPTVHGRQAIEDYFDYWIHVGVNDIHVFTEEIHGSGDTAVEIGRSYALLENGLKGGESRYMAVWKKEKGRWLIHRVLANQ